jgi:hypothetical protein
MERFEEWLRALESQGKRADAVPYAFRGYAWKMQVRIQGDFTGFDLVGRIKTQPDAPTDLAVMETLGPVFDDGFTFYELSLDSEGLPSTAELPTEVGTRWVQRFPYAMTIIPPSDPPYILAGGLFTLLGAV